MNEHATRIERCESTLGAILFASGMASPPGIAGYLLGASFDVLYQVAWNGGLTVQEQRILDESLPASAPYWSWDYCKRLVRAVLDVLMHGELGEVALLEMDVGSLAVDAIVRELESHDNALT